MIQKGSLVRYIEKKPPAGSYWPKRGNLYTVHRVTKTKVLIGPADFKPGAAVDPLWVPIESVELVSNNNPFEKEVSEVSEATESPETVSERKPKKLERILEEDTAEQATETQASIKTESGLPFGIEWPRDDDGNMVEFGSTVFIRVSKYVRRAKFLGVGKENGRSIVFVSYGRSFRKVLLGDLRYSPTKNTIRQRIKEFSNQLTSEQREEFNAILLAKKLLE